MWQKANIACEALNMLDEYERDLFFLNLLIVSYFIQLLQYCSTLHHTTLVRTF